MTVALTIAPPDFSARYPLLWDALLVTGTLAGFYLAGKLFERVLARYGHRLTAKTRTELDDKLLLLVQKSLINFLVLVGVWSAFKQLHLRHPDLAEYVWFRALQEIPYLLGVAVVVLFIIRLLNLLLAWYVEGIQRRTEGGIDTSFVPLFTRINQIVPTLIAAIIILQNYGQDISSLVVSLGVGSLAIGLAAQETLANMIGGFTLMIDRPFRVGDRIEMAGGTVGDVVEIGIRSTKLKTFDHTILIIPNAELVKTEVVNHSYPDQRVKGKIEVGVAYGSDTEQAKRIMIDAATEDAVVLTDPAPAVYFVSFGDSALNLAMRFWVEDYRERFGAIDRINTRIHERFAEAGIDIPFPIRTVYLNKSEEQG